MRILSLVFLLLLPALAHAQDDDRGYLTALLEDSLSGAGREVRITGFAGALSSRATLDELTIADADGIWLTLRDVGLEWNRSALLSGRVEVNSLTAALILLPRAPKAGQSTSPEAKGFSLPELPVSVSIGEVRADRVVLGAALLGTEAEVSLAGSAKLDTGAGAATLAITRIDGTEGALTLDGAYSNATRRLRLALQVHEAAGGIAAGMIGLPGTPAIALGIAGEGPIDAYTANIGLKSDGQERLTGKVTLDTLPGTPPRQHFMANLGGDIAPLFLPEYQAFFGSELRLMAEGARTATGGFDLSHLVIEAQHLHLSGRANVGADGLPSRIEIAGRIANPDGSPVLLPLPGLETRLGAAQIRLGFDAARDDGWQGSAEITALDRADLKADALRLSGSGRIGQPGANGRVVGGTIHFSGTGLAPANGAVAQALGATVSGSFKTVVQEGAPLRLSNLRLDGDGYALRGNARISGLDQGVTITGDATATLDDLARLSGLAGRDIGGRGTVALRGAAAVLGGTFDGAITAQGQDLRIGQSEVDRLLTGKSTIALTARRNTEGLQIEDLRVAAASLNATAKGWLRTKGSDLEATATFSDLSVLGAQYGGSLTAEARFVDTDGTGTLTASAMADGLALGQPQADALLRGKTVLQCAATVTGGRWLIQSLHLENPQLALDATPTTGRDLAVTARLADLGLFAPEIPGPVTLEGRVEDTGDGFAIDLAALGPGGIDARLSGTLAAGFETAALAVSGRAQAVLANAFIAPASVAGPVQFDLRLDGAPSLASLTGQISLPQTRLSVPAYTVALGDTQITADINAGTARISVEGQVEGGGQISLSGPVGLTAPFPADIRGTLARVNLRNPDLYTTRVEGSFGVTGPLADGAKITGKFNLIETELRVPSTGLGGTASIPDLEHRNEPAAVHATRDRAGLVVDPTAADGKAAGPVYGLDVSVTAPNRMFVRGRGLDAELGGSLRLQGTTADIVPSGAFDLVRGRLDILGKRFTLDQGSLRLEGKFIPYVQLGASTTTSDVTATILVEGPATEPEIHFVSVPELPEEEVLAQLLFGRSLTTISPIQAAQLASAVATLAGRGGAGVIERLRNNFGLDDLDITTQEDGSASLKAGKYLSRNLYSEVIVESTGTSEINLNLDLTRNITLKGRATSVGKTGIGVYLEKDY
jgi:translocation and assembly module TamB